MAQNKRRKIMMLKEAAQCGHMKWMPFFIFNIYITKQSVCLCISVQATFMVTPFDAKKKTIQA